MLNGCRSQLRRRVIAQRFAGRHGRTLEEATCGSAEQEIIRAEERRTVLGALATLSSRRREVLVLRYYLGLSEAEIAKVLGVSTGNGEVHRRSRRDREQIGRASCRERV